ncbi:hypothetical protein PF005_g31502, partial [Phytophthora fragariae]
QLNRFQRVAVTASMKEYLLWWWMVLHSPHLNGVSLEYFNTLPAPDAVIEMDASDFGLCALDPAAKAAITYPFSLHERSLISAFKNGDTNGFDINFRKLLSCAFAVHAWGARWAANAPNGGRPYHVHFRIDNTSAVAWQNKLASRNPRAQVIIRLLSWWKTSFHLWFSASHVPGHAVGGFPGPDQYLATYLRAHSVADSTFDQYSRAMNKWTVWASRQGVPAWYIGVPSAVQVQHISDFILHGFQFGFGSGGSIHSDSIMSVLQGVRHFFAASGFEFPLAHPHIRMLLKGISRLDTPRRRKAPVSLDMLEACFHSMAFADPFEQALWGVLCLAFFLC